jgi:hypothetical protein
MAKLIGIHGPLNGGKDTVANYIVHMFKAISLPPRYRTYAFARPLKEACKIMFGFTQEQMEDRILKETVDPFWGFTPRRAMQLLGTEYGRDMLRKDCWIRRAEFEIEKNFADVSESNPNGVKTIITDVRFQNEADWLRAYPDALLVYLEVPGLVKDEKYNHASEAGISREPTDIVIINDKSLGLRSLYDQIDEKLGRIL